MPEISLTVTPADGVTERYAGASGDHNPIHLDEAFARSVGLPGRILHGLWTAAQVARAAASVAPGGPVQGSGSQAHYALMSLKVQFRGMARIGPDVVISGQVAEGEDSVMTVKLDAVQDGTRLIRNAQARVRAGADS